MHGQSASSPSQSPYATHSHAIPPQSQQAYQRGDGASAHQLSEEGKRHGAMVDTYNQQASDYIFRENNAVGRVDGDTIDLHGQFVEEAERILEQRIRYAQGTGQTHLHVYVYPVRLVPLAFSSRFPHAFYLIALGTVRTGYAVLC